MSKKSLSDLFKRWVNRGRRMPSWTPLHRQRARLRLEEVEVRLAPATLPAISASDTRPLENGFAPQAITDPNNPNTVVLMDANGGSVQGQISRDGGQTWGNFNVPNPNVGPGGTPLTNANSPSVAMSRTGQLYVAFTRTTADFTTAGQLIVARFNVTSSGNPTFVNETILYQWLGQDPVYNPTVAVDNNVDSFTDPDTLVTTPVDTMEQATDGTESGKAVYVAWNTNAKAPQASAGHSAIPQVITPTAIFTAASRDQGATWSTPVPVNNGGFAGGNGGVAPQILFTPSTLNDATSGTGGKLQFIWQGTGGGTIMDTTQPDGGVLSNEVTTVYNSPQGPSETITEPTIPASGPDIPIAGNGITDSSITVNIDGNTAPFFNTLSDLNVTIALTHPHLDQLQIVLIAPNGQTVTLLENGVDGTGKALPVPGGFVQQGLPDVANLGVNFINGVPFATGTTFDDQAARYIYDPANTGPYIANFRPEAGSLAIFNGLTAAQLDGKWTLEITDVVDDDGKAGNTPGVALPTLDFWSMKMSSLISNAGFGKDIRVPTKGDFGSSLGSGVNLGGAGTGNASALGFGAGLSLAYDTTLGAFSPYSGRLYAVYTAPGQNDNEDIYLISSDDEGTTWSDPVRVNDDSANDNFSEGDRAQFMPSIAVDPTTGTVVVMWYDARDDASDARVSTFMATSIDGGETFSPQNYNTYLNAPVQATDQLSRSVVNLEPMPANLRAAGQTNGGSEAGLRQSVLVYGGKVTPFWTGNDNAFASKIYTATVNIAAGPRVIASDLGAVTDQSADPSAQFTAGAIGIRDINDDGTFSPGMLTPDDLHVGDDAFGSPLIQQIGYNAQFAPDGTRLIDGFEVFFDRPINVASFTLADIQVFYRSPTTQRDSSVPPTEIPIAQKGVGGALFDGIIPIDPVETQTGFPDSAQAFFIQFARPQSSVGTYSYSITPSLSGTNISDRIRSQTLSTFTPPDTPTPFAPVAPDGSIVNNSDILDSTITVPQLEGNPVVQKMTVSLDITHPTDSDLIITLFGPDPDGPGPLTSPSIILSEENGADSFFDADYTGTTFSDSAIVPIDAGAPAAEAPFTGSFKPQTTDPTTQLPLANNTLSVFTGLHVSGNWTLRIQDLDPVDNSDPLLGGRVLNGWSINFLDTTGAPILYKQAGNLMDQNADTRTDQIQTNFDPTTSADQQQPQFFTDGYSAPGTLGEGTTTNPLDLPADPTTLPLIAPGPYLTGTSLPGQAVTVSTATWLAPQILDITLSRPVDPTTFGPANVVSVTGPNGPISGSFVVDPEGVVNGSTSEFELVYGATTTLPTGNYTVVAGGSINVTDGITLNSTASAIDVTFDRDIDPTSFSPANILQMTGPTGTITQEQDLTVMGTTGTFTVSFDTGGGVKTTDPLPVGIPAAGGTLPDSSLQNALAALANVGTGNVTVTSSAIAGGILYRITFTGFYNANQPTISGTDLTVSAASNLVVSSATRPFTAADVGAALTVTGGTGWTQGIYTIVSVAGGAATLSASPAGANASGGAFSIDAVLTVDATAPAAASIQVERFQVQGIASTFNAADGGYRSFQITFPTQLVSGPYSIEFGPNQALPPTDPLYSIRSVAVPQLTQLITPASLTPNTLSVTFTHAPAGGLTVSQILGINGPSGAVSLAGISIVQLSPTQFNIVFPAALPNGQYVVSFDPGAGLYVAGSQIPIDMNFNAGVSVLLGSDPSSSTFTSSVYTNQTPVLIDPATDDGQGNITPTITDSSINVTDDFIIDSSTLQNIQLLLNILHPNVKDLNIDLIPPESTGVQSIRLFTGSLLAGTSPTQIANFTNTRFLDRVGDPNVPSIETATPPFNAGANGFFSPQNPLDVLLGKSAKGVWTLQVTNTDEFASGTGAGNLVEIKNWSLTLPHAVPGTGLGEAAADRFQASFSIFTQDPTNTTTQTTWTPVGPAPTNETANAARVSAIAVDPSDPSGNTVYVGVAGGGIWKTTDFLNADTEIENGGVVPSGPHYVPLTDFGEANAVNISSIVLFPQNNDPNQTIIYALTGESNALNKFPGQYAAAGVGVIRSMDGGKTWTVLDSSDNVDASGNILPITDPGRDHLFVGATGYKIVADPTRGKDGGIILYMALSGNAAQGGLWRSLDGGDTWTRIQAGNATDVVLASGSANTNDPNTGATVFAGNLQELYAAFSSSPGGPGVYKTDSAPAAASLSLMLGGNDNPLLVDVSLPGFPGVDITTNSPASTPNVNRRISLAVPALTGNALEDSFLRDWLYAMTTDANGVAELYVTKDAGAHWTLVRLPNTVNFTIFTSFPPENGTNNEMTANFNPPTQNLGPPSQANVETDADFDMAITVDPSNPNIVYMAGEGTNSIRIDLTNMKDAHNWTFYNNSDMVLGNQLLGQAATSADAANPAFTTEINSQDETIGGLEPQIFIPQGATTGTPKQGDVLIGGTFDAYQDPEGNPIDFLNLLRDYDQPFTTNSLIRVEGTGNEPESNLAGFYVNDGTDVTWSNFNDILNPNVPDQTGDLETENRFFGVNVHTIVSYTDPVTHLTRLLFGTDDGIFTGVDSGNTDNNTTTLSPGIGFSSVIDGNRNGNLQVSQLYSGAVQPSQFAADMAGALFYAEGDGSGFPVSSPDILSTGNLNYRGPTGDGVAVLVDPTGSGTSYEYRSPFSSGFDENQTATNKDFFRVIQNTADPAFSGGVSRTGGASGSLFDHNDFWPGTTAANGPVPISQPAVNPLNPNVLMIGTLAGYVYRSTNQGTTWNTVGTPGGAGEPDGSTVIASAFGASDPNKPTLTNNFMYVGTANGDIYSTTTGGAPWTLIGSTASGLDGSSVMEIVPDPAVGSTDVYAITKNGVYFKQDGTTATGAWVNITGNLFSITTSVFGNPADQAPALVAGSLTSIAVDWRYATPLPNDPNHTFSTIYVGGNGGVFRSTDFGTTWTFFPDVATDGAPVDGGYLPDTHITDLSLSIGNIDPASGKYLPGGLNMLVATTYGRGMFAIRLSDNLPPGGFISGPSVTRLINPNPVGGPSTELDVAFSGPVDPTTFTPADVNLVGPNGPIPVTSVTMTSVAAPSGVNPQNLFAITFPPQTLVGSYTITVGYNPLNNVPEIADTSGFLMNQNGNTTNGEPVLDQYTNTIELNAPTNNHLVVTSAPATLVAGQSGSVTIQVHDANDNLLNGINGSLTLSPAVGTGTFTPTTATVVNGVATFNTLSFETSGPQTVNVSFVGGTINSTSFTVDVTAATATQFAITPPSPVLTLTSGSVDQPFNVLAEDQFGNVDPTYNQTANLAFTSPNGATATIPSSVDLVNGVGSFTGTFPAAGTIQITATGPDPTNPANQLTGTANVTINPGSATHLNMTLSGTNFTVGDTATVTVEALDALNNVVPISSLNVTVNPTGPTVSTPTFSGGVATFTVTFTTAGTFVIDASTLSLSTNSGPIVVGSAPPPPPPTKNLTGTFALGTGNNGSPTIDIFNGDGSPLTSFIPFPPGFNNEVDPTSGGFTGGLRVAVGDVTGDGVADYVVGTGPGITASVVVVDGHTGQRILTYFPFDNFQGGVFVAVGDVDHDGKDEIAITPDQGGGPRVVMLSDNGGNFTRTGSFFGINDPNFRGGARAAIGDINGDGFADLVVSAGFGGGPRISVFDGAALSKGNFSHPIGDFFMFDPSLSNGAYVAVGDVNGDGFADIIGGAGPGGGPQVLVISGKTLLQQGPLSAVAAPIASFFGGDPDNRGGVPVAAKNIDGDSDTDILVGAGDGGGATATMYRGIDIANGNYNNPDFQIDALPGYSGGVFVG